MIYVFLGEWNNRRNIGQLFREMESGMEGSLDQLTENSFTVLLIVFERTFQTQGHCC